MVVVKCQGPECGIEFEAARPTRKFHADKCRKAAARLRDDPGSESKVDQAGDGATHEPTANSTYGRDVLDAVRSDLEKAGRLETVNGRVAMYLARKSIDPDCKNPAAMFKQMRDALDAALVGTETEAPPTPDPEEDDEVSRARKSREKARQAAGLT